jgi:hypothetical protein
MDSIIFSRLKSFLHRRLEITPEKQIQVNETNLMIILAHICEFVEQQQQQIDLTGEEKKELALSYYRRVVLENLNNETAQGIYPDSEQTKRNEFISGVQFFIEKHVPLIIDTLIGASKGRFLLNINKEQQVQAKKKGKKLF